MTEGVKHTAKKGIRATVIGALLSFGMALAASSIIFFAWMAEEVFEGDSVAIDGYLRDRIHSFATDWLTALMQFSSFLGSTMFLGAATVLLITMFLVKRQNRSAIILAVVMTGAVILNYVLKVNFQRPRPLPYFDTPLPASFSFPSGHSLFSACFYVIIAWLIASQMNYRTSRAGVWAAAVFVILLVGISRVYLGVHFPTDVAAGYLANACRHRNGG